MLFSSRVTDTVPVFVETVSPAALTMYPSTYPVKEDPSVRFSVREESLPTRMAPDSSCAEALRTAVFPPPVQPSPQTESRTFSASSFTIFTPSRVMTALVFVTWKTCPLRLVMLPPVMVKWLVPLSASPDMDW